MAEKTYAGKIAQTGSQTVGKSTVKKGDDLRK